MSKTAVEWLAEKYNYVTWMRNRDEISAGLADEWRIHYLDKAKAMEKQQIMNAVDYGTSDWGSYKDPEAYYNETYNNKTK